jgi:hypothetical protein
VWTDDDDEKKSKKRAMMVEKRPIGRRKRKPGSKQ